MKEFTLLHDDTEVAEISMEGKWIEVVPANLLKNLSLVPSLLNLGENFGDLLGALREAGFKVTLRKGPFKITLE